MLVFPFIFRVPSIWEDEVTLLRIQTVQVCDLLRVFPLFIPYASILLNVIVDFMTENPKGE